MQTGSKLLLALIDLAVIGSFLVLLFWATGPKNICGFGSNWGSCYSLVSAVFLLLGAATAGLYVFAGEMPFRRLLAWKAALIAVAYAALEVMVATA